jgi:hypothetical protein
VATKGKGTTVVLSAYLFLIYFGFHGVPQSFCRTAQAAHVQTCGSITNCDLNGKEALSNGDLAKAERYFRDQVGYAEDAQDEKQIVAAYNNMSSVYLNAREYFRARIWIRLALRTEPKDTIAEQNLKSIQERLRDRAWPTSVNGTYVRYAGRGFWDAFCVNVTGDRKIHTCLRTMRIGGAWREYGPASIGDIECDGELATNGGYRCRNDQVPSCNISMTFADQSVSLKQEGDCGFGYGVDATGDYDRIDYTKRNAKECADTDLVYGMSKTEGPIGKISNRR